MKFIYRAKTEDGVEKAGEVEAANSLAAAEILRKQSLFVTSLSDSSKDLATSSFNILNYFSKKVALRDKVIFTQQLAVMLKSGFPLVAALDTLKNQTNNKYFSEQIAEISEEVKGGNALSDSLSKRSDIFPKIYSQIAKSGEKSGKLDKVLTRLAGDLSKNYDLMSRIKNALIYPIFILISLVAVVVIIMIFVVPQLTSLFNEVGATLPLTTRILVGVSNAFVHYWWLIITIVVGLYLLYRWTKQFPEIKSVFDWISMKTPVVGQLQKKAYLATFVRTLATLTAAGLPILEIFDTLVELTGNVHYQNGLRKVAIKIENGSPVGASLFEDKNFPPLICEMITVGEKSGNLDYVLRNLAKFLEKDVAYMSQNLTTLLEPILMIVMGAGVAFILMSVLGPIYSLVQVIK